MSGGARGGGSGRGFYGWWIVGAGFSLEALIGALMFHSYGAYVVVLREEFGWSKTMLSAAFAMARAESGILGPVRGWLTDRFGHDDWMTRPVAVKPCFLLVERVWVDIQRGHPILDPLVVNDTNAWHICLRGITQPDFRHRTHPSPQYGAPPWSRKL